MKDILLVILAMLGFSAIDYGIAYIIYRIKEVKK